MKNRGYEPEYLREEQDSLFKDMCKVVLACILAILIAWIMTVMVLSIPGGSVW